MTTLAFAAWDPATMTRRNLRHVLRYPVTLVMAVAAPVLLLLLFTGVFGAVPCQTTRVTTIPPNTPGTN